MALANNNLLAAYSAERTRLSDILRLEKEADPDSDEYRQALENFRAFLRTPCKQLTEEEFLPQAVKKSRTSMTVTEAVSEIVAEKTVTVQVDTLSSKSSDSSETQSSDAIMTSHETTAVGDFDA